MPLDIRAGRILSFVTFVTFVTLSQAPDEERERENTNFSIL